MPSSHSTHTHPSTHHKTPQAMQGQDGEEAKAAAAALGALTLETDGHDEDSEEHYSTPAASPATTFHDASSSAPNSGPPPSATPQPSFSLSPRRPSAALDLGQRKHTFILSHAGKPIFSRHGDEQQLAPFMGMVQAILALSQSVSSDKPQDCVRSIRTTHGTRQFVFLVRRELTLLVVASTKEPEPFLKLQLEYLYQQVVLLLTARRIERCFAANASYDLRELLGGTDNVLAGVVDMALPQHDSAGCLMTGAVPTLPLDPTVREEIGQGLVAVCAKTPQLQQVLYGLVLCGSRLVTLVQPKEPTHLHLRASDLLLLANFVTTQPSFKVTESWTPVCLPRFNNTGFLYAYVGCLDPVHDIFLLLVSANDDPEQFKVCMCGKASSAHPPTHPLNLPPSHQGLLWMPRPGPSPYARKGVVESFGGSRHGGGKDAGPEPVFECGHGLSFPVQILSSSSSFSLGWQQHHGQQ